jgi:hypothetical protein
MTLPPASTPTIALGEDSKSCSKTISVSANQPKNREAFAEGQKLWYRKRPASQQRGQQWMAETSDGVPFFRAPGSQR